MIECLLKFRNVDSTENINSRLAGLIPKGIVKGGIVIPEANSLQVRIKGDGISPFVFLAFASDGMVIREKSEEHVLPVEAGIISVIVLRAKYVASIDGAIAQFEVLPLGAYENDPDPDSLIRLCSVSVPAGATSVLYEHINMGYRDSIEGFSRKIVRDVVDTREELPSVSGFPAMAEINFLGNNFALGSLIRIETDADTVEFPFTQPTHFTIAPPSALGLVRTNLSQREIQTIVQSPSTGLVTVNTTTEHGLFAGDSIRISDCSVNQANGLWTLSTTYPPSDTVFYLEVPLSVAWSGEGGSVVNISTNALVTAKTAAGVTHTLSSGSMFTISGSIDPTFEGTFEVVSVLDAQTFTYNQTGYPNKTSGFGIIHNGIMLPPNAIEIGESATATANNFESVFRASMLSLDISARAIGSSIQFTANRIGELGNTYKLEKEEPSVAEEDQIIILSGSTFEGGVEPNTSSATNVNLSAGDLYVVMSGISGTMEIWGYDGIIFRNLTSASTITLLDFHRRNQFINEKHLTENEKEALKGTVGVPSNTNRFVTEEDTGVITDSIAAALAGADSHPPSGNNRYLTEYRRRGELGKVEIPIGQDYVKVPVTDGAITWEIVVGEDEDGTDSSSALSFFNVVFTDTDREELIEYSQFDFSPVFVEKIYVTKAAEADPPPPPFISIPELNPSTDVDPLGFFPRRDAYYLDKPVHLWVKLNTTPNNGSATLLFSKVVKEKDRKPASDMYTTPQRILPTQVRDLINKASELRFNSGITVIGKIVSFPTNLFTASNIQEYTLKRILGSKASNFTDSFSINFETGDIVGDVDSFSPITFTSIEGNLGYWTKYLLAITPQGRIQIRHISQLLEKATDLAFAVSMFDIAQPSFPYSDGSFIFAAVYVCSDGIEGTTILDIIPENLELYPYQSSNSKDYGAPIVCGDGVESFGHFTGSDAHIRAFNFASSGQTIKLEKGTYSDNLIINKDNITFDGCAGAIITAISDTAFTVVGKRCTIKNIMFNDCNIAIDLQGGSDNCKLSGLMFGDTVTTKIKAPSIYTFSPADVSGNDIDIGSHSLVQKASGIFTTTGTLPTGLNLGVTYYVVAINGTNIQVSDVIDGTPITCTDGGSGTHYFGNGSINKLDAVSAFNTWMVSDGTNLYGVGDFNSPSAIQDAHDVAMEGDVIYILAGVYSKLNLTKNSIQYKGIGGGEVRIDGAATLDACITITGSNNQFENLLVQNAAIGIECQASAKFNHFSSTIIFSDNVTTFFKMPETLTDRHYNYHPLICGRVTGANPLQSAEVTIGDGLNSWGDYVGQNAINLALTNEIEGTRLLVKNGIFDAITFPLDGKDNFTIQGLGDVSIIQQVASPNPSNPTSCITISGDGNKISGFYLKALNNEAEGFTTLGVDVSGNDNYIENINFELTGSSRIISNKQYIVRTGFRNRFIPHTGARTGYVSWTVGDGIHSFGDFNGMAAISQAINMLPYYPSGNTGVLSGASGSTVTFSDPDLIGVNKPMGEFVLRDLHRYVCITASTSSDNVGSYKIIAYTPTSVTLERYDGISFTDDTNVSWNFLSGTKIWVLSGQYSPFTIPSSSNDIDIEAWGSGSDAMIVGETTDATLLTVNGNRCSIKGFKFVGGVPSTGVAITLNGSDNTFKDNSYETAVRYLIGADAVNNRIYDAPEFYNKTYYTVSTFPSRGDFVGSSESCIQAALDAAASDDHINKIVLGKGTWTLASTINVPEGITLEGSGAETELLGNGLFPSLTLDAGGYQTIKGIRFNTFSNSMVGSGGGASNVFAYSNWFVSAPIHVNVTGNTTMNISI